MRNHIFLVLLIVLFSQCESKKKIEQKDTKTPKREVLVEKKTSVKKEK